MLRLCALRAASGREEMGRGDRIWQPCVRAAHTEAQEGSLLPEQCIFCFSPVFGDSWSSQTDLRPLWCLTVEAHLSKHDFCCCGCSAPADQRKANRAGHPLFTESWDGLGEPCWPDKHRGDWNHFQSGSKRLKWSTFLLTAWAGVSPEQSSL